MICRIARRVAGVSAGVSATLSLALSVGCRPNGGASASPSAHNPSAGSPVPIFRDVAAQAGLDYTLRISAPRPLNILQTIGNGCAFLDYDGDGNLDILLVGPTLALFRGDGRGHFRDMSAEAGLTSIHGHFLGCAVADYDDDGFPDVYVTGYRGGALLHNEPASQGSASRRFRDVTAGSGIAPQPWGTSAEFADVDGDGRLDLYIGNYVDFGTRTVPQMCTYNGKRAACGPEVYSPLRGVLYRNVGGGRFHDATGEWGAVRVSGKCLGVAFADYDSSGRQSLAIANDEMPADLLHNGGRAFANVADAAGIAVTRGASVFGGMGLDWGDYDNDGKLDLSVTTFRFQDKVVFHNLGDSFEELSASLGLGEASRFVSFGVKWIDFDNDGWLDLIMANGHVQDNSQEVDESPYRQEIALFHNKNGAGFESARDMLSREALRPIVGRGLAIGDFDNDGRMDVLVVDSEGAPMLLHNESRSPRHWVGFRLDQGPGRKNRDAIGAVVRIEAGASRRVAQCQPGGSYMSSSDIRVHFGLGDASRVDRLTVRWPDGFTESWPAVGADRYWRVIRGKGPVAP